MHAILGKRVHVITSNDYLAYRDASLLTPMYESLGISVASLLSHMGEADRSESYKATILYGTLREIGFDLLRETLRYPGDRSTQGNLEVAIVDEADQSLIDEASTPLIIGGAPTSRPRSILKIKSAIEDIVQRQSEIAKELEQDIERNVQGDQKRTTLLAQLMLSKPESNVLQNNLGKDKRLTRRIKVMIDSDLTYDLNDHLTEHFYYLVNYEKQTVTLTDLGYRRIESIIGPVFDLDDLHRKAAEIDTYPSMSLNQQRRYLDNLNTRMGYRQNQINQVHQMLRAYALFNRDEHYVVTEGRIVLVDELSGRRRPDNKYQFGLQGALEAKEGLEISNDTEVLAQISVRGLMLKYNHLSGITGTASDSEVEFQQAYGLSVVSVSPSNDDRRVDLPTMVFESKADKLCELVQQTALCHRVGRPVLIGTITVDQSDDVSKLLEDQGICHKRLDAVNNAEEAEVIRTAGSYGAVTVATNMAGRGTDILLDPGLDETIAANYAAVALEEFSNGTETVIFRCGSPDEAVILETELSHTPGISWKRDMVTDDTETIVYRGVTGSCSDKVKEIDYGFGLYVIGSELNDSRRVDLQLRGRTGRQGCLGSSRFIVSYEDRLLAFTNVSNSIQNWGKRSTISDLHYYQGRRVQDWIDKAQSSIETENEARRRAAHDFDVVMEKRDEVYNTLRKKTLDSQSFFETCLQFVEQKSEKLVESHFPSSMIDHYPALFQRFSEELMEDFLVDVDGLWELGIERMKVDLSLLMIARLDELRFAGNPRYFDETANKLFLQTTDDLRTGRNAALRDLLLSVQLCGSGHKGTVSEFIERAVGVDEQLQNEVLDTFLLRLYTLYPDYVTHQYVQPIVLEDVHEILI